MIYIYVSHNIIVQMFYIRGFGVLFLVIIEIIPVVKHHKLSLQLLAKSSGHLTVETFNYVRIQGCFSVS